MQFGAHIFGVGAMAEPAALLEVARLAKEPGCSALLLAAHSLLPRQFASTYPHARDGGLTYAPAINWHASIVALGFLAAHTSILCLGTSITVLPMRHPMGTAKQIATADDLSGGRIIFRLGVGWMQEEFQVLGASFHDRGRRMDEHLRLMQVLWMEEHPYFEGQYLQVADSALPPQTGATIAYDTVGRGRKPGSLHAAAWVQF
ncbi:MAG: LLM class flavin-dependent oxidoreductase [Candidatus Tectimicrobiota bacterium]